MANEPMVILKDLANQNRQEVSYDAKTKNVKVGASVYTPAQLQSMGGQIANGRWTLPQASANQIVGSASNWQSPAQQTQMSQMQSMLQNMSKQSYQSQAAQLASNRDSQLKDLISAYQDSLSETKGNIRDANSAYDSQSSQINNQAYLNAEQTALYGNDMGIQNSQQMVGLMAGDNARKNSLINENMTERDKRIAEINDRLQTIKSKKSLDVANLNSQYNSGLLQAQSTASQAYNNNMFGLMQDDYSANRYNQNTLNQMDYQNDLAIKQMDKQHTFDMDTLTKSFENDLKKMQVQYGYSSSLQSQSAAASAAAASKAYQQKISYAKYQYDTDLQHSLNGVTPGTSEYKIIQDTKKQELQDSLKSAAASTMFDFQMGNITTNYQNTAYPTEPSWSDSPLVNALTGYDSKYDKYTQQVQDYNNNPNVTAYKRMMENLGLNDVLN